MNSATREMVRFAVNGGIACGGFLLIFMAIFAIALQALGVVQLSELLAGTAMVLTGHHMMPAWVKKATE
jgi:hypothetical protein